MRLLLAVHAFPPRSIGGVESYTSRLARALTQGGHQVVVLTAVHDLESEPHAVRRRRQDGVEVVEVVNVHHQGMLTATYSDPDLDVVLDTVIGEAEPDCVHLQHLLNLSTGVVRSARRRSIPVVWTLHDYWLSCPRDGLRMRADGTLCATVDHSVCARCLRASPYLVPPLQRGLSRLARRAGLGRYLHFLHSLAPRLTTFGLRSFRRFSPPDHDGLLAALDVRAEHLRQIVSEVNLILTPTAFVRDRMEEWGIPTSRMRVVPYGAVPSVRSRPAGARRRFGFIGTLAPHKGTRFLIQAFRGLSGSDLRLEVFGSLTADPFYVAELRRTAGDDGRIRFRGRFMEGEQGTAFEQMDVLICPSIWWENSPLTVLEALAAGVPVIATATGGVPEIIPGGEAGLLVPPADVAALRAALDDVASGRRLSQPLDPLPLKTVAHGARELEALYGDLVAAERCRV